MISPAIPIAALRIYSKPLAFLLSLGDRVAIDSEGLDRIPPLWLRYRVQGDLDIANYANIGRVCKGDIESALGKIGRRLEEFPTVLDFGCGSGRTLRWMRPLAYTQEFHGTDIDAESIEWCAHNLPYAHFGVNNALPPLDYPDECFDLVYGLSVFTHLEEEAQLKWIAELRRILKPGGVAVLSFLGYRPEKFSENPPRSRPTIQEWLLPRGGKIYNPWNSLTAGDRKELLEKGFFYMTYQLPGISYGNAFHVPEYLEKVFSPHFAMREYIPNGMGNMQDIGVFEKPAGTTA